jgi:isoleucyl-tRNA synthetase
MRLMTTRRFAPLPADRPPAETEAAVALSWREHKIFEATLEATKGGKPFVFYEGPPTANGMPHHGHVLTRVMKDLFPRYKTMCGFHVERKAGWDTHGLPVEIEVEKVLGLEGKQDIEKYGIAPFIDQCRKSVWKYQAEWEKLTDRIGFWIDMGKPYITYSKDYVESVWWSLKRVHELGLLYKGHKILPWCPRDMTGLSSHEVGQGYLEVEDPAITVAFKLKDAVKAGGQTFTGVQALAWTTTPWTLLSNVALVVGPTIDYVVVRRGEATYLLAQARHEAVLGGKNVEKGEVLATVKGAELAGLTYEPLFPYAGALDKPAQRVVADGYVTTTDGTGIVHAAPAFGVDDERVCKANGLAFVNLVKPDGKFTDACGPFAGRWVKEADGDIARDLKARGQLVKQERIHHEYPHCWRCKTPLLYYAREAWFIETSRLKERLVALNKTIEWNPEHIRDGRFGDFLENNKDWALSRERYWGTPLPAWECTGCGKHVLVESRDELRRLGADVPKDLDPHRPGIDAVTIPKCGACGGGPLKRVKEVIDCWYDSGAMPYAQWGYPHAEGSKARFQANFPADFICEAIDQTRGWFYTLHAISTLIFDRPSYSRCLVLGHTLDAKGKKQSKKDKNYRSPTEVLDAHGADAMRWFFYSKMSPGQGVRYTDEAVRDARGFLLKLLNVYKFFQQYASADGFDPAATPRPSMPSREPLDRWVTSELHSTIAAVRAALEAYEWTQAAQAIETFVDGLSNWYVRRSRDRGWSPATPENGPKWAFWWTLYEVLTTLSRLLAPFVPFLADELHRVLVRDLDAKSKKSVHLEAYPEENADLRDPGLEARMGLARRAVALGSQVRKTARLNLRQPLGRAVILLSSPREEEDVKALADVIGDELNVKTVDVSRDFDTYVAFDVRVDFKRLGPRFGKKLGAVKKGLRREEA